MPPHSVQHTTCLSATQGTKQIVQRPMGVTNMSAQGLEVCKRFITSRIEAWNPTPGICSVGLAELWVLGLDVVDQGGAVVGGDEVVAAMEDALVSREGISWANIAYVYRVWNLLMRRGRVGEVSAC
ncbi:hypothetical protein CVT26_015319 [Gymnopilus dilepis]|uniref:Uncharacterized protein n=1 Tax=Gymnopilus dilepis TaxID=231916 RepID=A0A409W4C3_9AGAR|nr:hypothetical protein CVT26_015319 [Gymnopilus dilepis]